ncbi:hypothetical protein DBP20_01615 [Streptomyces sp. CS131]|nr:hypothetical protein DBP20_01615 [Streptomyces sp. CS131]
MQKTDLPGGGEEAATGREGIGLHRADGELAGLGHSLGGHCRASEAPSCAIVAALAAGIEIRAGNCLVERLLVVVADSEAVEHEVQ